MAQLDLDSEALAPPCTSLVGYYRFDGNTSDESGYGNHGTIHGSVQFVAGQTDQAVYFNNPSGDVRVTQWVEFPSLSWLSSSSFTIAIRYNTPDSAQQDGDLFGAYAPDLYTPGVNIQYNDQTHSRAYTRVGDGTRYYWAGYYSNTNPNGTTTDGQYHWQIVVLDRSLGALRMYIDDHLIEQTTQSDQGAPISSLGTVPFDRLFLGAASPLGRYGARLTAVDELRIYGCPLSDSEVLSLVTPCAGPTIASATASPSVLWPPNHKMVPVSIGVTASDDCSGPPVCHVSSVTSNEPATGLGSGDQQPDWEIVGDLLVSLRAERAGTGSGRIYTVKVECVDSAGNSASTAVAVTVPHNS